MENSNINIDARVQLDESIVFGSYKTNTFYNKQVFVINGHQAKQEVLFQLFGNIGCRATKDESPQNADFILINTSNNYTLPQTLTYGDSKKPIKTRELINSKGNLNFITEERFLAYIKQRTELVNDSATKFLLKQL